MHTLPDTEVVAMIRSLLVLEARPGRRDELLRRLEVLEVRALIKGQHGLLDVDVATAADDENEVLILGSWSSRAVRTVARRKGSRSATRGRSAAC